MTKKKPKIVFFDLETLANLPKVMKYLAGMSAYPGLTMKATHNSVICFGYKVLGEKNAKCINAWDYPKRWKKDVNDDYEVVKAGYDILKDADAIVGHNSIRFDLKFLNSRLVYHGFPPLPKIAHIDTCRVASSKLFLFNNRLNTVAEFLGCELKMENGGWSLWEKVLVRDKKACATMTKYCKQDVEVLEQVFIKLRPLIKNIPNYNIFNSPNDDVCPNCGSNNLKKNGTRVLPSRVTQRYICGDCGTQHSKATDTALPKAAI